MEINYEYGNGYKCSCCREVNEGSVIINNIEEAIQECIELNGSFDDDFYITEIYLYDDEHYTDEYNEEDEEKLIGKIYEAIKDNIIKEDHKDIILELESKITEIENWFETLETQSKEKGRELKLLQIKLKEIKK
jgi:hypothetical protein